MKLTKGKKEKLDLEVAILIKNKIKDLAKEKSKITFAIAGGNSVSGIFENLKKQNIKWEKVHIFMVDERLVALDSPQSNFKQAEDIFISYLVKQNKISKFNLHPYIYFNLPDEQGINAYKNELREFSHKFDIVLLSSGEDGHIASLYPNHETIKNSSEGFIITHDSPKKPSSRISASRKLLEKSQTAILLFFGKQKQKAYENFMNKKLDVNDCPAKIINKIEDSYVFTDLN